MAKAHSLTGFYLPGFYRRPDLIQSALRFLVDGVALGTIKANLAVALPLSRTAEAHGLLERRETQGVVVLDPRA